jgi:RNA polymerase sigma factor (sigma-70 family)
VYKSDPALIQACIRGEKAAWDALVDRYGRLVYSIPRRYGLTPEDSDEVFQNVFVAAHRALGGLKDQTRLSSWLITTAHRECWRVGKRADRYPELDERIEDVARPSEDQLVAWERQHLVQQGLEKLGGKCEQLLRMIFLDRDDPGYETIADRLGMKVGSIGPTRARCLQKLQNILEDLGLFSDALD